MASINDIGVAAAINIVTAIAFLLAFAILRIQPVNDRVYFPKWYLKGLRTSSIQTGGFGSKFINLDFRSYVRFLNWMPEALKMPEPELVHHAGLDSVVYLRIYLLGLKIFFPIACVAFTAMVPVNWTNKGLDRLKHSNISFSDIDKLSLSNIPNGSGRFWVHLCMAYAITFWTCFMLKREYQNIALMRLQFLANDERRPNQFTVLVRNIPTDPHESVCELVEHFFKVNHPDHYLTYQAVHDSTKLSELVQKRKQMQNLLDYNINKHMRTQSKRPVIKINEEKQRLRTGTKSIVPAAFVSFKSRWGAAVCAQTEQSRDPTEWLTEWAAEPRDIYYDNLAVPYVDLKIRRIIVAIAYFFLTFFFMIPIAFVQSLANIEGIEKAFPFLKPLIEVKFFKSIIQGFLPGIALKIFLMFLPRILMQMSKFEGFVSTSSLERRAASRFYMFQFINVFLGSIVTGTAFQQLNRFLNQSANDIPKIIGVSIPMKATFFITYIMVDGWAGVAGEILRLKPLIIYHLKNSFLVRTENDREEATDAGTIGFNTGEPQIQLYFLLGLVYAAVSPILLPFIILFFALAYVVYRHQVINVYNQTYESAGKFWPDVHRRVVTALVVSQLLLMGLLSTKQASKSTPLLLVLPVLTIGFHMHCKCRYLPAFVTYSLQYIFYLLLYQEAMIKDTLERTREPNLNLKAFFRNAYAHPEFRVGEDLELEMAVEKPDKTPELVSTKRGSWRNTPLPSGKHSWPYSP
ncbi:unnamed protein product [Eruca vesicaria subsp. sativa]|uniref:Uncharacterized protein n=1 Tax=Eruca vesicaria subsp. sativa TaxID=29727 RepID=A0ABC8J841_ERUVS|nr:unnamed protein product [Eruca vesicaria subsp. sativa]